VDREVWGEEGEGLALGEDEGWADGERGLRHAECAEGVYCGAGVEKKSVSTSDEILAAFQEGFDADFSDDEDDLECDEGTPVQANIRAETGMRLAVLDSAASNVWFDEETFAECHGRDLEPETRGAGGADGSALDVVGTGVVTFSLWRRLLRNIRVRVMLTLPSGILIWRRLMLRLEMSLNFSSGVESFSLDTPRGPHIFSGRILHDGSGALEQVEVIYEADLEDAIRELDLQEFGDEEAQKALRTLLLRYRDLFPAKTSTVPGFEFGLDAVEGADLTKLNRPAFPKYRVEKELEAERVWALIDCGILEPSESPYVTNNILVGKKRNADGSSGRMRVTSDLCALNAVTENLAYPTKDVKTIVRWLATKQVYSVADLRDGYYNVNLRKKDRHLTAVRTILGLLEYAVMALGLKDACAFFQKVVNEVYMGLRFTGENEVENVCAEMAAYLDDRAVGSDSVAEHLVDLKEVLERTRGAVLKLKLAKCLFGKRLVDVLGHRVSHGLVRPSDDHTAVFANFKEPRNASELLRFIGLVIFFW
jgi:Reverse transcriptase (RNA-dependent DNA polymerase)